MFLNKESRKSKNGNLKRYKTEQNENATDQDREK